MTERSTLAGGCFLTLCIMVGFFIGLSIGDPMKGVLGGTLLGATLAAGTWLADRRRRG